MTFEELRVEAAKLSAGDRARLAQSLAHHEDAPMPGENLLVINEGRIESWDHARLKAEIQIGVEQLARGEGRTCDTRAELHEFFEEIKAEGRQRVAAKAIEASR